MTSRSEPERYAAIRAAVEDWKARFPHITQAWLHQSDDGARIWLTDGEHGPVLAEARLPVPGDSMGGDA